jgi:type IV pilus assembly protein PilA
VGSQRGFTVIELLIVVVIIGLLAVIAIPRFSHTSQRGADAAAITDLRNAMSAQETYLVDFQTYTLLSNLAVTTTLGVAIGGGGTTSGYTMTARHQGSGATFEVSVGSGSSTEGKIIKR